MGHLTILSNEIRTLDNFYSLNDLHKASGEEVRHAPFRFMRLDQTQELIQEIDRSPDLVFTVLRGGKTQGTWVCKELVYAYAMWISAKFHLQVIRAFDQLSLNQPSQPLSYSTRVALTIENGQVVHSSPIPDDAFIVTKNRLCSLLNEPGLFTVEEMAQVAQCSGLRLAEMAQSMRRLN